MDSFFSLSPAILIVAPVFVSSGFRQTFQFHFLALNAATLATTAPIARTLCVTAVSLPEPSAATCSAVEIVPIAPNGAGRLGLLVAAAPLRPAGLGD